VVKPIVYWKSFLAALGASILVLVVSSRIEHARAERYFQSYKHFRWEDFKGYGAVAGGPAFGPGILTWALAVAVFAVVYSLVLRRGRPRESQFLSVTSTRPAED